MAGQSGTSQLTQNGTMSPQASTTGVWNPFSLSLSPNSSLGTSGTSGVYNGADTNRSDQPPAPNAFAPNASGDRPDIGLSAIPMLNSMSASLQGGATTGAYGPPPGNNPYDWYTGQLGLAPGQGSQGGPGAMPTSAFGGVDMSQLWPLLTGTQYPGPVPSALAPYGTQSSLFGNLVGLGNPGLLTLMLLMANRPTTTVPFDPVVQPGSPDQNQGVWRQDGNGIWYPDPGTTLPWWVTPPFQQPPPLPGPPDQLPGVLPPVGHGPFGPGGGVGGGEGAGEGEGGPAGESGYYHVSSSPGGGQYTKRKPKGDTPKQQIQDVFRQGPTAGGPAITEVRNDQGDIVYSRGDR